MKLREFLDKIERFAKTNTLDDDVVVELDGCMIFHDVENVVTDTDPMDGKRVIVLRVTTY